MLNRSIWGAAMLGLRGSEPQKFLLPFAVPPQTHPSGAQYWGDKGPFGIASPVFLSHFLASLGPDPHMSGPDAVAAGLSPQSGLWC